MSLLAALDQPKLASTLPASHSEVAAVARHHRLSPLLSATCASTLPGPLAEAFRRDRVIVTARGMQLDQVAEECIVAFEAEGIPTIVLKGLDYERRLYGAPGLRPTSDVDLLIPSQNRRAAFAALDRLGFEPRAAAPGFDDPDYHEVAWRRRDVEIDLHTALAPTVRCRVDYSAVWSQREPFRVGATAASVLARTHAAVFQALHMTIDHFAVPAVYLLDLSRLIPTAEAVAPILEIAADWRCRRPVATALALTAAFLPNWGRAIDPPGSAIASRVIAGFGEMRPLPRPEQLLRKIAHFDGARQAALYLTVQGFRNLRERFETDVRKRAPRERLGLSARVSSERATTPE
jgi:Uncharacterised nucleotidyltransferase